MPNLPLLTPNLPRPTSTCWACGLATSSGGVDGGVNSAAAATEVLVSGDGGGGTAAVAWRGRWRWGGGLEVGGEPGGGVGGSLQSLDNLGGEMGCPSGMCSRDGPRDGRLLRPG